MSSRFCLIKPSESTILGKSRANSLNFYESNEHTIFRSARTSCTTSDWPVHPSVRKRNLDHLYTGIHALWIITSLIKPTQWCQEVLCPVLYLVLCPVLCIAIKTIPFAFRSMSFMNCDFICGRKFSSKGRMGCWNLTSQRNEIWGNHENLLTFHVLTEQFLLQTIGQQIKVKGHSYVWPM